MLFKDPAHERTLYFDDPGSFDPRAIAGVLIVVAYVVFQVSYVIYLQPQSSVEEFVICIAISVGLIVAGIVMLCFKKYCAIHHTDRKVVTGWLFLGTDLRRTEQPFESFAGVGLYSQPVFRNRGVPIYTFHVSLISKSDRFTRVLRSNRYEKATLVAKRIADELGLKVEDRRLSEVGISSPDRFAPNAGGSSWLARPPAKLHLSTALVLVLLSGLLLPAVIYFFQTRALAAPFVLMAAAMVIVGVGALIESHLSYQHHTRKGDQDGAR